MAYTSTATPGEIGAALRAAGRAVLLTHAKPDGDALGSLLAVRESIVARGGCAEAVLMGPVEPALLEIGAAVIAMGAQPTGSLRVLERDGWPAEEPDLVVIVDTGSWAQLEPASTWLRTRLDRVVGIDHHAAGSEDLAARRVVDRTCASTTQVLEPILDAASTAMTPALASALYMGLATDTGWFRYSSADARVFALASRLLSAGAQRDLLYARLEQNAKPPRLALLARTLSSLELRRDGSVAIMTVRMEDFAATGAGPEDAGGFVNEPMALRSVRMAILLSQVEPGVTRASFRSKPLLPGDPADLLIDVNAFAARFGGGGHVQASGARLRLDVAEAKARIVAELASA